MAGMLLSAFDSNATAILQRGIRGPSLGAEGLLALLQLLAREISLA